jgi:hypothetical protein
MLFRHNSFDKLTTWGYQNPTFLSASRRLKSTLQSNNAFVTIAYI